VKILSYLALLLSFTFSGVALSATIDFDETESLYSDEYSGSKKCEKERHKSYNKGYGNGLKHKGGYDGGYKTGYEKGHETGYENGYEKGSYDTGNQSEGVCSFVFKFDGFIVVSEDRCRSSDVCEDNDINTIDVCLLVPQLE
tara:strand:+ start:734 stop:1159 length:426 start_codon:yes stop_codon:yes gene_type:complete